MSYESDLNKIYRQSIDILNSTDKQIAAAYRIALTNIEEKIAKYRQDIATGKIRPGVRELRAKELYMQIDAELRSLSGKASGYIRRSYLNTYQNTYYRTGYFIEKNVNTALLKNTNLFMNYPVLNRAAVDAAFDSRVAGMTFKDRALHHQRVLRFKVRQAVSSAVAEGIPVKELAFRIKKLNDTFGAGMSNIQTLSRTELLKAYSLGNENISTEAENGGVSMDYLWSTVADANARASHVAADRQKAKVVKDQPQFIVGGVLFTSPRIVSPNNMGADTAGQVINCRCTRLDIPFGIKPNKRVVKTRDGKWVEKDFNQTADDWIRKNYPERYKKSA